MNNTKKCTCSNHCPVHQVSETTCAHCQKPNQGMWLECGHCFRIRAGLERLWNAMKTRRHMDRTQGEHQENYSGEQFAEAEEMIDEAMEYLDTLTPAKEGQGAHT